MKAFNLTAKTIEVAGQAVSVISLGESGRGRLLFTVPCPEGLGNGDNVIVTLPSTKPNGLKTKPKIAKGEDGRTDCWCARISTEGSYIRGACGNVSYDPQLGVAKPELVAKGYGAFGDAGRTGTWDDIVVVVMDGTVLRIKPTRADAYYLWFQESQVSQLTLDELQLLGLDADFSKENRVRL